MSIQNEIPPLFVELNMLHRNDTNQYICWKEKARWIRYEEQAEDVSGRWSKPHVATIPHTSIDELKELLSNGLIILDTSATNFTEIIDVMANELLVYFKDLTNAKTFADLLCLPFMHHHEKKIKKTASGNSLIRLNSNLKEEKIEEQIEMNTNPEPNLLGSNLSNNISNRKIKYQYSFTDSNMTDESSRIFDFKENVKFKKKVNSSSEGASILIMPVDFVHNSRLLFLRLENSSQLPGFCEVRLKTKFIVLIIGPSERRIQLYEIGRAISTCLADDVCRELFYFASNKLDIIDCLNQFNKNTMVIPPSEWNPKIRIEPPEKVFSKEERKNKELAQYIHDHDVIQINHKDSTLEFSIKPFNGLICDIRRKLPFYFSDFTDCFNLQSIATTLYMYLVSICTLVAFGGLFGQKTENIIGTIECIIAGSICGILFSLFSGQPLNIISATGPVLILESIIKSLCDEYEFNFMEMRLWIGIWTFIFLIVLVMFNLSFLVKYITRFTEDCFASLVAIVFIIDAVRSVFKFKNSKNNLINRNITNLMNLINNKSLELIEIKKETVFYFSFILFSISFILCLILKDFKKKPFLPTKIRHFLSDFSVMIAIFLTSILDFYMELDTLKLTIPSKFQPTTNRTWIVSLNINNSSFISIFISIIPAVIATILIFMDQQITAVISNRRELKLKKSHGYHLDLVVVAISVLICSFLGLPWFVAATVLTLTHINSLKIMSENNAPGERPIFSGIREQRGTSFFMSVLIGLSVFLTRILSHIPMAALYGVFMFMGVSALNGIQFVDRVLILFMPNKYQPDEKYLRHVNTKRVHLFTIIQVLSTAALFIIKYIDLIALSFPILIAATTGIRKILEFLFTQEELYWLDDLLPGSKRSNDQKLGSNGQYLIDRSKIVQKDEITAENRRSAFLYQSAMSNSFFDFENENQNGLLFIDSNLNLDESTSHTHKDFNSTESPVRFHTHYPNIVEDKIENEN